MTPEARNARGVNHSGLHTDFMIGSDEVAIAGVTAAGEEVPVIRGGDWVLA
jgi:aminopeptidase